MGEYEIVISPDGGSIQTEAKGFKDNKCLDGMKDLFDRLGEADVDKKPEAHIQNSNKVTLR